MYIENGHFEQRTINEPRHEISNNVVCATSKCSDQPAHTRRLIRGFDRSLKYSITVNLLTEPHFRFLSLKGSFTDSSESTLVKIPHCLKSRVSNSKICAHTYTRIHNLCNFFH